MLLQGDTKSGTGDGYACNKDSIAGPGGRGGAPGARRGWRGTGGAPAAGRPPPPRAEILLSNVPGARLARVLRTGPAASNNRAAVPCTPTASSDPLSPCPLNLPPLPHPFPNPSARQPALRGWQPAHPGGHTPPRKRVHVVRARTRACARARRRPGAAEPRVCRPQYQEVGGSHALTSGSFASAASAPHPPIRAYNVDTRSLTRVVTAPSGAEVSGISTSRVGDKAYLTMTAQHPGGDGPPATAEEMEAQRGYVVRRGARGRGGRGAGGEGPRAVRCRRNDKRSEACRARPGPPKGVARPYHAITSPLPSSRPHPAPHPPTRATSAPSPPTS